jgi:hypothetical protein
MELIKVLLIEDNENDVSVVKEAVAMLQNTSFEYCYSWEMAQKLIDAYDYDIIIADTVVYDLEADKLAGGAGKKKIFPAILELTEAVDPPIPVIAYTDKITIRSIEDLLPRIIDFWHKKQIDTDYIAFRIRKIRELIERERNSSTFIKYLKTHLDTIGKGGLPWGEKVSDLLSDYERYGNKYDKAENAFISLSQIAGKIGISESFTSGFYTALNIDQPASSLLSSRPHLHHCINLFLLGYYILNMCEINWHEMLLDSDDYYTTKYNEYIKSVDHADASAKVLYDLNCAWFISSLLHDSGNAIAKYYKIKQALKDIAGTLKITAENKAKDIIEIDKSYVTKTMDMLFTLQKKADYTEFFRTHSTTSDHGFASSVFIAVKCKNEISAYHFNDDFIPIAVEAVAFHNYATDSNLPTLDLCAKPISTLLVFCDAIQSWDREMTTASFSNHDLIDKVEVRELNSIYRSNHGPIIDLTVRYYMHSLVAKHRPTSDLCKKELIKNIEKYVNAPFNKHLVISKNNKFTPLFKTTFELGNQEIDVIYFPNASKK